MLPKPKQRPARLDRVFEKCHTPIFFVTFNTHLRRPLLACDVVHAALVEYGKRGTALGAVMGRYVILPDHIHLFVMLGADLTLSRWLQGLKRHLTTALIGIGHEPSHLEGQRLCTFWQPGSFDHMLRQEESYAAKWDYVRQNPVRASLVAQADEWPYQGEIERLEM